MDKTIKGLEDIKRRIENLLIAAEKANDKKDQRIKELERDIEQLEIELQ